MIKIRDQNITKYLKIMPEEWQNNEIVKKLDQLGFFTSPASTKYHLCEEGGLFTHSYHVTEQLKKMTERNNTAVWTREDSPFVIGMFHDLCKCCAYVPNEFGWEYNNDLLPKGHGIRSIALLSTITPRPLTEEEMFCIIYHMGAFVPKEEWSEYTEAVHKYPNVLWTHTADMIAAHIIEINM